MLQLTLLQAGGKQRWSCWCAQGAIVRRPPAAATLEAERFSYDKELAAHSAKQLVQTMRGLDLAIMQNLILFGARSSGSRSSGGRLAQVPFVSIAQSVLATGRSIVSRGG